MNFPPKSVWKVKIRQLEIQGDHQMFSLPGMAEISTVPTGNSKISGVPTGNKIPPRNQAWAMTHRLHFSAI